MYEPLSEKQIEFMEFYHDTTALTENLIPENFNAPQIWNSDCKCITLRPYQFAMQNYSYMYAEDSKKSLEENFLIKKGAGDCYQIGSRDTGKSFFLKIDVLLSIIHGLMEGCVASCDAKHLKNVTEPVASYTESHKFLKLFHLKDSRKKTVVRNPLTVITEHGCLIKSVNEKIDGNNPGTQYHSLHYLTHWYEEYSYHTQEGMEKRIDSGSSLGNIERLSGIPDLRIGSPMTKTLNNPKLKNWIWRLPQYVREDWSDNTKQEKIDLYGGESSTGYRLNVEAEIIEGAYGFWDIKRLKENCLKISKRIKVFEISTDNFHDFENRIVVERLAGSEQVYICADIGGQASPTEIIIIFFDGTKFKYAYNISLFKLIQKEQAKVFKFLYDKLGTAFIAIDATCDNGVIIDMLFDKGIPQEHLLKVFFNKNIDIDFEKDNDGKVLIDNNGQPIMKQARTIDWAMHVLENMFYEGKIDVPLDEKFLKEFNGYIAKRIGTKIEYGSTTTDHLHQAFQVFGICKFYNEFNILKNKEQTKRSFGVFNR